MKRQGVINFDKWPCNMQARQCHQTLMYLNISGGYIDQH